MDSQSDDSEYEQGLLVMPVIRSIIPHIDDQRHDELNELPQMWRRSSIGFGPSQRVPDTIVATVPDSLAGESWQGPLPEPAMLSWLVVQNPDDVPGMPPTPILRPFEPACHECPLCLEIVDGIDSVELTCGHHWCHGCFNDNFRQALKSRASWPPRCCSNQCMQQVNTDGADVDEDVLDLFEKKMDELFCEDPTYCPAPDCGLYIPESLFVGNFARCPKAACMTGVCKLCKCRQRDHRLKGLTPELECPDSQPAEVTKLIEKEGWQRCPKVGCRMPIERNGGCDHMTCLNCKTEFCYACGKTLEDDLPCNCRGQNPWIDEE